MLSGIIEASGEPGEMGHDIFKLKIKSLFTYEYNLLTNDRR